jgi:hypothetical protein
MCGISDLQKAQDLTAIYSYPFHDPSEQILVIFCMKKARREIYSLNFASNLYDPDFYNFRTAAVMSKFHHGRGKTVLGGLDGTASTESFAPWL